VIQLKDCSTSQVYKTPASFPLKNSKVDKLEESNTSDAESDLSIQEAELEKPTALNKLLVHLLSLLIKKDEDKIFAKPVTEKIAPGYFDLVKHPMDFSTIASKIKSGMYKSYQIFISDFDQICRNAQLYNPSRSIFYKKASELRKYGDAILSKRNIRALKEELPFIVDISLEELGFSLVITPRPISTLNKPSQISKKHMSKPNNGEACETSCIDDNETEVISEYEKLRLRNIAMRKQMMANVIQDAMDVSQSMGSKRKKLFCMRCDFVTDSTYKLEGHVNYVHEKKTPFKCEECEFETAFEMNLSRHIKFEHYDKSFKCENCDMVTPSKIKLRIHSDTCDGINSQNSEESNEEKHDAKPASMYEEILNADLPLDDEEVFKTKDDSQKMTEEKYMSKPEETVKSILVDWIETDMKT